ncbi:MAG: hypothetical protein K8I30_14295 [Anaerolineae bacterium]|nr:hypothetical protein [Anaerolineae bacterium]
MKYLPRALLYALFLCIAPALALAVAQTDCPAIVQTALDAAEVLCQNTGRNQACYGNIDITAQPQTDVPNFRFQVVGDTVNVSDLQSLKLSPMNEQTGAWGVALLRLQANLPDTLPGQNVTFLLFGDVEISSAVDPSDTAQKPMQAFRLKTGVSDATCEEAPESGLLVQTPEGADEIAFNVNGVDVSMGSTVLFQADPDEGMSVSTLEGAAFVAAEDGAQPIVPGSWVRIAINRELQASAGPELPESYERRARLLQNLPIRLLQRRIQIAPPLTPEQLQAVRDRIQAGELPCGEEPFPSCDKFARFLRPRIELCRSLPARRRSAFCEKLARFMQNIVFPAATMTADAGGQLFTPPVGATLPPRPPGG